MKGCEAVTTDFGLLLGSHVGHQVANAVAVSELVVVPGRGKKKENRRRDLEAHDGGMCGCKISSASNKPTMRPA